MELVSIIYWLLLLCVLLLPIVWRLSHAVRYYIKMFLFNGWVMLSAMIMFPIALLHPGDVKNLSYVQWLMQQTLPLFGVSVEVKDRDNLKFDGPRVMVCNHQSSIDLISLMQILPPRSTVLIKKELLYAGPFGITGWLCGLVFVDRSNREKAHETMERVAKIMHERNVNIWIYPEGTRNHKEQLLPFKKGAFHLAVQAKVPICPVIFSSYRDFLSKKNKIFNPGKVIVTCLPAVSTEGLTAENVPELTDRVYASMQSVYQTISQEVHEQTRRAGNSIIMSS